MNRLLTTLLVWLLMATLPLHALAASINMSCAPGHQESGAAVAIQPAAGHADHAAPSDAHVHHDGHAPAAAHCTPDGHPTEAKAETSAHASCSACSAFCVGAVAPPSSSLPMPTCDGSEALIIDPADFVPGFIPDSPQRPPRH